MDVHCCFTAGACFFVLIEQIINITVLGLQELGAIPMKVTGRFD